MGLVLLGLAEQGPLRPCEAFCDLHTVCCDLGRGTTIGQTLRTMARKASGSAEPLPAEEDYRCDFRVYQHVSDGAIMAGGAQERPRGPPPLRAAGAPPAGLTPSAPIPRCCSSEEEEDLVCAGYLQDNIVGIQCEAGKRALPQGSAAIEARTDEQLAHAGVPAIVSSAELRSRPSTLPQHNLQTTRAR